LFGEQWNEIKIQSLLFDEQEWNEIKIVFYFIFLNFLKKNFTNIFF